MTEPTFSIVSSLIGATILAALGWLKSKETEDFEPIKLFSTYFSAILIAVIYVFFKVDISTAELLVFYFGSQTGFTAILERLFKFLWRTYIAPRLPPIE